MAASFVETPDWSKIPAPEDDGGARHLTGKTIARVPLAATDGTTVDLASIGGRVVVFIYPRTGRPDEPNPEGWDLIPGARGCTPQCCAFREHYAELRSLGIDRLFGLSTQDTAWQREAAERLHLPFPLLSDHPLCLTAAMRFPVFETSGMTLLKRLTLVLRDGAIEKVFYPVFPPDRNAADVVAWLRIGADDRRPGSN